MSTRATLGYQAVFYLASVASPLGYTAIIEMKSIDPGELSVPKVKATHLLSPNATEEYIAGLLEPPEVTVTGNYIGEASQAALDTVIAARLPVNYKITAPVDNGTKTLTRTGNGFLSKLKKGPFTNDNPSEVMFSLQTVGLPTDAVA